MKEVDITVINWEKYNPETSRTRNPHWFRINRDTAMSDSLDGMSAEQCWVWIQILSECCRKNSAHITLNINKLARLSSVGTKTVLDTIDCLILNNALLNSVQSTAHTEQNNTIHDGKKPIFKKQTMDAFYNAWGKEFTDNNLPLVLAEIGEGNPSFDNRPVILRVRQMMSKRFTHNKNKEKKETTRVVGDV